MARVLDFTDDALVVRYGGFVTTIVLLRQVRVPYGAIRSVSVGMPQLPRGLVWRVGMSARPSSDRRMGRFWAHGQKLFLDIRDRRRAVVIDLEGADYDVVAIEPGDDPEWLAGRLREHAGLTRRSP